MGDLVERLRTVKMLSQRNQMALQAEAADEIARLREERRRLVEALKVADDGRPSDGYGMTLRDWFAGQAVGAVIRQCAGDAAFGLPHGIATIEQLFADKAYQIADAMLAERSKP